MRPLSLLLALSLLACADAPPPDDDIPPAHPPAFDAGRFDEVEDATWRAYLVLQDALAHDLYDEAHAAAQALHESAAGELAQLTGPALDAEDINGLRIAFRPISELMIEHGAPTGFGVAYCPMAFDYEGGRWVQQEGHLMNPYFGASMLRCGAFEETDDDA